MTTEKIKVLYILGGGHSGSTLVSLILGTAPTVFNAGEINFYNDHKNPDHWLWPYIQNVCSCGKHANDCEFWSPIEAQLGPDTKIYHYISNFDRIKVAAKIFWPFWRTKHTQEAQDDYRLFKAVLAAAKQVEPNTKVILDSSKSITRLIHLRSHPNLDISVIFLARDGRGYINSYLKVEQRNMWVWLLQWLIVNILSLTYLKKEKIEYYHLSYTDFCKNLEKHRMLIGDKFGFQIPKDYVSALHNLEFHARAGNPSRLKAKQFKGIAYDEKWRQELRPWQKRILTFLLSPFNQIWVNRS